MITLFSTPRPFRDEFDCLQRNAIASWRRLGERCQVILLNDEEDTTERVARELGVEFITECAKNEFGTPLLDDVFRRVRERARHPLLAHVNADIVLFPDFLEGVEGVSRRFAAGSFLLLGRRIDLDVAGPLAFHEADWAEKLLQRARGEGTLHGYAGMDYWVFPAAAGFNPPAFCVGRPGMDSWLVFEARRRGIPVIDATDAITIVHQNHGYPKKRAPHFEVECARNIELAGGRSNFLTLREADHLLMRNGDARRPPLGRAVLGRLSSYRAWRMLLGAKRWGQRVLAGASR